eukprot:GHVP01064868.1.p1 GENE.GHVP01064868.1~~GHVP01064868.1.p1  ORF type:complete len:177 (+),score=22.25 GHVP01064868.1:572-1102(+)
MLQLLLKTDRFGFVDLGLHRKSCEFRPITCCSVEHDESCDFNGEPAELVSHLEELHGYCVTKSSKANLTVSTQSNGVIQKDIYHATELGAVFVPRIFIGGDGCVKIMVFEVANIAKHSYKVILGSNNSWRKTTFEGPAYNEWDKGTKDCLFLSAESAAAFKDENNQMDFHVIVEFY